MKIEVGKIYFTRNKNLTGKVIGDMREILTANLEKTKKERIEKYPYVVMYSNGHVGKINEDGLVTKKITNDYDLLTL